MQNFTFNRALRARTKVNCALLVLASALLLFATDAAWASGRVRLPADEVPSTHEGVVNTVEGVAIKGYDPVAYFTGGRPRLGDPKITAEFDGATWRFATEAHRKAFVADPAKYEPDFGGFCAYGVAHGNKVDIDPAAYTIVNDRLYLNVTLDVRRMWLKDLPEELADGDKNWPTVKLKTDIIR
ncbi:MAG TPA: YHS domain-containing (seleno)protein [Aliidongia sp.]|nr:YHS domain-containing (seleno)protein [Aliidongia sp.]